MNTDHIDICESDIVLCFMFVFFRVNMTKTRILFVLLNGIILQIYDVYATDQVGGRVREEVVLEILTTLNYKPIVNKIQDVWEM